MSITDPTPAEVLPPGVWVPLDATTDEMLGRLFAELEGCDDLARVNALLTFLCTVVAAQSAELRRLGAFVDALTPVLESVGPMVDQLANGGGGGMLGMLGSLFAKS